MSTFSGDGHLMTELPWASLGWWGSVAFVVPETYQDVFVASLLGRSADLQLPGLRVVQLHARVRQLA
jgi:hypothetical protein